MAIDAEGGVGVEGGVEADRVAHAHLKFGEGGGGDGAAVLVEEGGVGGGSGIGVGEEDVRGEEGVGCKGCNGGGRF